MSTTAEKHVGGGFGGGGGGGGPMGLRERVGVCVGGQLRCFVLLWFD